MQPITRKDFDRIAASHSQYYCGRWDYYARAIELAGNPKSVLEIGPHLMPLYPAGDSMDIRPSGTFCRDAGNCPWPIDAGQYDVVIGLQVFEHLGRLLPDDTLIGNYGTIQPVVFREAQRVAQRRVVLSFPFEWDVGNMRHDAIDRETIGDWTCGVPPIHSEIVGNRFVGVWPGELL